MSYNADYYLQKFDKTKLTEDFAFIRQGPALCHFDDIRYHYILDADCYMKFIVLSDWWGSAWIFSNEVLRNRIKFDSFNFIDKKILDENPSDYYAIVFVDWS